MAGLGTVQRIPRGFLEMLSMKGTGQLPSELNPNLQAVVDARDLYLADVFDSFTCNTNVAAVTGRFDSATVGRITVPSGELWLLQQMSVTSTDMAAGESYTLRLCLSRANFSTLELSPEQASASGVNSRIGLGWRLETPAILRPADTWGIFITQVTAGAHAFTCNLSYSRLTF